MKKLILCLVIAFTLLTGSAGASAVSDLPFADVPETHWAYDFIVRAWQNGVIRGTSYDPVTGEQFYEPDGEISLAELTSLLTRAFYRDEAEKRTSLNWQYGELNTLLAHGIYQGLLLDIANLSRSVNRYEMAMVTANLLRESQGVLNLTEQAREDIQTAFAGDWEQMPPAYYEAVSAASFYGVLEGEDDHCFHGERAMTRAEAVRAYSRILDAMTQEPLSAPLVPLVPFYRLNTCYFRSGDWTESQIVEHMIQYRIDLDKQFYPLESVTLSLQQGESHTIFLLSNQMKILQELRTEEKEITIPITADVQYVTVAIPDTEESTLRLRGTLTEEGTRAWYADRATATPYTEKYLSVIGDSLSAMRGYTPQYPAYPNDDVTKVTQMWWYLLAKQMGMNVCKINACSGSGVNDLGVPEIAAADAERGKDLDACGQNPDLVILLIGCNDFYMSKSDEEIYTQYNRVLDDISSTYPDAEIRIATYPHQELLELNPLLRTIASERGLQLIELEGGKITGNEDTYCYDGLHFNAVGMEEVAAEMAAQLLK